MVQEITRQKDWKSGLVLVTAALNIVTILALILGGLNWITQVNTRIELTSKQIETTAIAVQKLQEWSISINQRHAQIDAIQEYEEHKRNNNNKK